MFLRRHRKWGEDGITAMTAAVAPGAHDLLAGADSRSGGSTLGGNRLSVSLQVTTSDLSVGSEGSQSAVNVNHVREESVF